MVEGEGHVRSYDVSVYGSAVLLRDWNLRPFLPLNGGAGAEGLAFVPDRFLAAAGFVGSDGVPRTSSRGMGGLMFVGHQNGGALYAFTFVGEYRTAYDETAALHFDRGNGRLYIWHDAGWDTWEDTDLTSTPIPGGSARQLWAVRTFTGPHHRNNEGLTLASIDECSGGFRNAFLTTDGGGYEFLTWFRSYAEGCTTLSVSKNTASGTVELSWSGGVSPFTILRAEDPLFIGGRTTLLDEAPVTTLADSVLTDGRSYFYLVP